MGAWTLANTDLRCDFTDHAGFRLTALTDVRAGRALLREAAPFCLPDAAATVVAGADSLHVRWPERSAELGLALDGPALRWRLELAAAGAVRFPFLAQLDNGTRHGPFADRDGRPIFRHADWPLPGAWVGDGGRTLTLLMHHGPPPASYTLSDLWGEAGVRVAPTADAPGILAGELVLHDGGWPAAFDRFRAHIRPEFDLSQYRRPDLAWYGDQLVQHFTFLYGREILNLETGQFEVERLLDEGERDFGGYDGFLIWGVYPRIGVDERTQWDFYDDFPGGRAGLRAMGRQARARGVRFFIPYKPWDRSASLHGQPAPPDADALAQLAADVEADGVFLDTMAAIGGEFRAAIDRARPGVALCSEARAKGAAFATITGSWDQTHGRDLQQGNWSASPEPMPRVDLWRFLFPEHRLFVTNRHAVGADRLHIIQRGFFGGMGWVVWQDIFGLTLTWAPDEAALLKKCRTVLAEHRQALASPEPTPLVATRMHGVYANLFPAADKRLWTLYNENDAAVSGPVLAVDARPGYHFVDVWHNEEVTPDGAGGLTLRLDARSVGAVAELPRLLAYDPATERVTLAWPVPGATLQWVSAGATRAVPATGTLRRPAAGPQWARLVQEGELLDQIALPAATA